MNNSKKLSGAQFILAIGVLVLGVSAFSYSASTFTVFSTGQISASEMNANFEKLREEIRSAVPAGALVAFSGDVVPDGYLLCPTVPTTVSRTAYPALFAALGVTWGTGDSATTFGIPWFPEGYTLVQANANLGQQTSGEVKVHNHGTRYNTMTPNGIDTIGTGTEIAGVGADWTYPTTDTGGAANMAAGTKVKILVKI